MKRRISRWLVLGLGSIAACAIQTRVLSIEELTARADLVLRGRVQELACERTPEGRLQTRVALVVLDTWKGVPRAATQTVVASGGVLGERRSQVPDQVEFSVGEEVVIFAVLNERREAVCVGLDQGKFRVTAHPASGGVIALNRYHPAPAAAVAEVQPATATATATATALRPRQALALDELARRVRSTSR